MKKAFSLFELIIVFAIISLIVSYLFINWKDSIDITKKSSIKSDIALIRSAIARENSKNILKDSNTIFFLDKATINKKEELLFDNILKLPLISTNEEKKEIGKWIKTSKNSYKIYLTKEEFLKFEFKDNLFECKSSKLLCKKYE